MNRWKYINQPFQIKDPKISQLINVFDRKIASLEVILALFSNIYHIQLNFILIQAKERDLEEMVRVKEHALSQSERLRSQYRNHGADGDVSFIFLELI